jgi:hypothetical protein
VEEVK